jgi:hypothetical protein
LYVAAGGGGDAITATALARASQDLEPVVMTYSWDRLMVDPVPGPRSASDFTGLRELAPHVLEVVPSTTSISPAASSLPRLSGDLPARLLLLDPANGAVGMSEQIRAAAAFFHLSEIAVLDVGGDILTDGTDPGLRSPLADQLALAASVRAANSLSGEIANVYIAAPGIDGELPTEIVLARLDALKALLFWDLNYRDVAPIRNVFRWHPSEASGLLAAAADGLEGLVEVRDAGDQVELTRRTTRVFVTDAWSTAAITPAPHLMESQSLAQAEEIVRDLTGISEIRYETEKASKIRDRSVHIPERLDLPTIDAYAHEAQARGAQYISMRRLAELLQASSLDAYAELCDLLAEERPDHFQPSVYRTEGDRSPRGPRMPRKRVA